MWKSHLLVANYCVRLVFDIWCWKVCAVFLVSFFFFFCLSVVINFIIIIIMVCTMVRHARPTLKHLNLSRLSMGILLVGTNTVTQDIVWTTHKILTWIVANTISIPLFRYFAFWNCGCDNLPWFIYAFVIQVLLLVTPFSLLAKCRISLKCT